MILLLIEIDGLFCIGTQESDSNVEFWILTTSISYRIFLCYDGGDGDGYNGNWDNLIYSYQWSWRWKWICFVDDAERSSRGDLFREILRDEAVARLDELGKVPNSSPNFNFWCNSPQSTTAIINIVIITTATSELKLMPVATVAMWCVCDFEN